MSHRIGIDDAAWASPWRRRRVGAKVGFSMALVLTALLTPAWPGSVLVALVAAVATLAFARVRPSLFGAAVAAPVVFLVIGCLGVALRLGGHPTWSLGPLGVDRAGLVHAADIFAHGLAGTLALLMLATTTPMVDLVTWLRGLRIPPELLDVAALMYRMLFLALSISLAVHAAVVARLGDQAATRRRRWGSAATELSAVALRTGHRAVRMQRGLELRGFESDLSTLPVARERSVPFVLGAAASVAAVWVASLAVNGLVVRSFS